MSNNFDYVISKLHALNSKNFIGEKYKILSKISSIEHLHKELFPDDTEPVLVKKLYTRVEMLYKEKVLKEIIDISKYFNFSNEIINSIILSYEIDNIKILINSHLSGIKSIKELIMFKTKRPLDYNLLFSCDISDFKNIQIILKRTSYKFILPNIEQKNDLFLIENLLDKYYYNNIINSLKKASSAERINLNKIIVEEMNWQNILWALRTKIYYEKNFEEMKDTFISYSGLISQDKLKKIYEMQFIPNEYNKIFNDYPKKFQEIILSSMNENGEINLPLLEDKVNQRLINMYIKYFYINRNILAVISYIFIKKFEYNNIIKLVESLRYKIPLSE